MAWPRKTYRTPRLAVGLGGVGIEYRAGRCDPRSHHSAEIDAIQIQPQRRRQHLDAHRLAGSAGTGEQGVDAESACSLRREFPGNH